MKAHKKLTTSIKVLPGLFISRITGIYDLIKCRWSSSRLVNYIPRVATNLPAYPRKVRSYVWPEVEEKFKSRFSWRKGASVSRYGPLISDLRPHTACRYHFLTRAANTVRRAARSDLPAALLFAYLSLLASFPFV